MSSSTISSNGKYYADISVQLRTDASSTADFRITQLIAVDKAGNIAVYAYENEINDYRIKVENLKIDNSNDVVKDSVAVTVDEYNLNAGKITVTNVYYEDKK